MIDDTIKIRAEIHKNCNGLAGPHPLASITSSPSTNFIVTDRTIPKGVGVYGSDQENT